MSELASFNFNIKYHAGKQNMDADALSHLNWEKHEECDIGQVEATLASSLSTIAVPESLREQLLQSVLEQPTIDPLPWTSPLSAWDGNQLVKLQMVDPTIKCLIHFRNIGHKPSAREMKAQTCKPKQLLNQWDRIEEIKGVLYRSNVPVKSKLQHPPPPPPPGHTPGI